MDDLFSLPTSEPHRLTEKLSYYPHFLSPTQSKTLFDVLLNGLVWEQPRLKVYGREVSTPRLVSYVADPGVTYTYSHYRHEPQAWPTELAELKHRVEAVAGVRFNSALCNYYRNGDDYMGWHSDAEPALGQNPCVASVSLGAQRDFKVRPIPLKRTLPEGDARSQPSSVRSNPTARNNHTNRSNHANRNGDHVWGGSIPLSDGGLLLMEPGFQSMYQHSLPRRVGVTAPRLNITFRNIFHAV